jgi:hypothetical protein
MNRLNFFFFIVLVININTFVFARTYHIENFNFGGKPSMKEEPSPVNDGADDFTIGFPEKKQNKRCCRPLIGFLYSAFISNESR